MIFSGFYFWFQIRKFMTKIKKYIKNWIYKPSFKK